MEAIATPVFHTMPHYRFNGEANENPLEILLFKDSTSIEIGKVFSKRLGIKECNWRCFDKLALVNENTQALILAFDKITVEDIEEIKLLRAQKQVIHLPMLIYASSLSKQFHLMLIQAGVDAIFADAIDGKIVNARLNALIHQRQLLKSFFTNGGNRVEEEANSYDKMFLKRAHQVVLDNYTDATFNIEQFVVLMRVSRTMLYVKIKELTNKTTSEFVRDIRLEEAARLLKEGWLNVSEVAFKVGFRDPKYLSKKFKNKFGISPRDYRRGIDSPK
ncbi:MAG: helix-turn-helix transcriptional regulator [Carboxylicivirga sp.]|jgi:AraC-like DNA-binding protein|nr:helix-turn-helix transcriptional regulator [Carboxylicivirga sp.]